MNIPLPDLSLPADGKGSAVLNQLVAEGKLHFDPSTGKFSIPVEVSASHSFVIPLGPRPSARGPARMYDGSDTDPRRNRFRRF